ncbi:MAG: hypothetical protein NT051_02630 [Candidatus Micrarchaeota archaeon]|nr:hypothetical protein [Candidatus Micrarchaeota archaeon]
MELNKPVGKARAFFNCSARPSVIRRALKIIKPAIDVPDAVQLKLGTVKKVHARKDPLLSEEKKDAVYFNIKYSLTAAYPGATNETAAGELVAILNQAYQSPLFKDGEKFVGKIFYEKDGKFCYMQ